MQLIKEKIDVVSRVRVLLEREKLGLSWNELIELQILLDVVNSQDLMIW